MTTAARAALPIARGMSWGPLAAAAGVLLGVVLLHRPWEGQGLTLWFVRIAVLLASIGACTAVDDAAAVTLAASPTTLGHRRLLRLALAGGGAAAVAAAACAAMVVGGGAPSLPMARVAVEGAGMLLLALALATLLGGDRGAMAFGGLLLGSMLVQQWHPHLGMFPMGADDPAWTSSGRAWTAVVLAALGALVAASTDPARRRGAVGSMAMATSVAERLSGP